MNHVKVLKRAKSRLDPSTHRGKTHAALKLAKIASAKFFRSHKDCYSKRKLSGSANLRFHSSSLYFLPVQILVSFTFFFSKASKPPRKLQRQELQFERFQKHKAYFDYGEKLDPSGRSVLYLGRYELW